MNNELADRIDSMLLHGHAEDITADDIADLVAALRAQGEDRMAVYAQPRYTPAPATGSGSVVVPREAITLFETLFDTYVKAMTGHAVPVRVSKQLIDRCNDYFNARKP